MISITKKFEFEAAHYLVGNGYGRCKNLHGHSWKLEVEVGETMGPEWMIMNFTDLKKIVREKIIEKVDHQCLNVVYDFQWPTCEWLVLQFVKAIEPELPTDLVLLRVRLQETSNSYAEWRKR